MNSDKNSEKTGLPSGPSVFNTNGIVKNDNTIINLSGRYFLQRFLLILKMFPKIIICYTSGGSGSGKLIDYLKNNLFLKNFGSKNAGNSDSDEGEDKPEELINKTASFDFLLKIPGISTIEKAKYLMTKVKNLKELCNLSKSTLRDYVGNDKVFNFLHHGDEVIESSDYSESESNLSPESLKPISNLNACRPSEFLEDHKEKELTPKSSSPTRVLVADKQIESSPHAMYESLASPMSSSAVSNLHNQSEMILMGTTQSSEESIPETSHTTTLV